MEIPTLLKDLILLQVKEKRDDRAYNNRQLVSYGLAFSGHLRKILDDYYGFFIDRAFCLEEFSKVNYRLYEWDHPEEYWGIFFRADLTPAQRAKTVGFFMKNHESMDSHIKLLDVNNVYCSPIQDVLHLLKEEAIAFQKSVEELINSWESIIPINDKSEISFSKRFEAEHMVWNEFLKRRKILNVSVEYFENRMQEILSRPRKYGFEDIRGFFDVLENNHKYLTA